MKRLLESIILITISFVLSFIIGFKFIMNKGIIYLSEHFEVYTIQDFLSVFFPLWNEKLQIFNLADLPKLYIYLPLSLLANFFGSYKSLQIILLLLPYPIAFISTYILSKYINSKIVDGLSYWYLFLSSLIASFIFVINPWFAMNPRNVFFRIQFAFLPLLLFLFLKIIEKGEKKYIVFFSIIMALVVEYRFLLIIIITHSLIFLLYIIIKHINLKEIFSRIKHALFAYIIFIFLSIAKFLPVVLHSFFVPVQAVEQFSLNQIQRETLLHVFTTKIYEWTASGYDLTYDDFSHFLFIPVVAFSFLFFLFKFPKNKKNIFYLLFPPILVIIFIPFVSKELSYDAIISHLPLSDYFGRLLRHARWNIMPIIMSLSIMGGMTSSYLLLKYKKQVIPCLILILIFATLSSWPLFTGDMNGYWNPSEEPEEYLAVNNMLDELNEGDHHVLWMPSTINKATWSEQYGVSEISAPTGIFPVRSSAISSYGIWEYNFFNYYNFLSGEVGMSSLTPFKGDISRILAPLNVKYVIFHYDLDSTRYDEVRGFTNDYIKQVSDETRNRTWIEPLFEGNIMSLYELQNNAKEFEIREPVLVSGGLTTLASLSSLQDQQMCGTFFVGKSSETDPNLFQHFSSIVLAEPNDYILFYPDIKIIPTKPFTNANNPSESWYPSTMDQALFLDELWRNGIQWNWQFDYGGGIIFTRDFSQNLENVIPDDNDIVVQWNFENNQSFVEWDSINSKTNKRYNLSTYDNVMEIKINSQEGIEDVKSPLIPVRYEESYRINFKFKGVDCYEVHLNLLEYDDEKKLVNTVRLTETIGEGDFNWKEITCMYNPENRDTAYSQLQICQGHCYQIEPGDYPKFLWIKELTFWNITGYKDNACVDIEFNVDKTTQYRLFLRYFENELGGKIRLNIDDFSLNLDTYDQINCFTWEDLGSFNLSEGNHKVILENLDGFNAVNIFAIVPEENIQKNEQNLRKIIQDKDIVYLLEAENNLYSSATTVNIEFYDNASNGKVLKCEQGEQLSQHLSILQDDLYMIGIRGIGNYDLMLNEINLGFFSKNLSYNYFGPLPLNEGDLNITIKPSFPGSLVDYTFEKGFSEWSQGLYDYEVNVDSDSYYGNYSLMMTTSSSERRNRIVAEPINVTANQKYLIVTHMKFENANGSNIALEEYDKTSDSWELVSRIPSGQFGSSGWKEYTYTLNPLSENTTMRFRLIGGSILDENQGNATTWFDEIHVYPLLDHYLDVIWIYPTKEKKDVYHLFKENESSHGEISYTKINPTHWSVRVNVTEPFLLSFAEGYDPLWIAYVNGHEYSAIPLYSVINGFLINETGDIEITIKYRPQEWFEIGSIASIITFIGCVGYLFYDRVKYDKRIQKLQTQIQNFFTRKK